MQLEGFHIDNFSVVVTAKQNNPTILNPDFLKINHIVSEKMEAKETVTTPIFSMVKYSLLDSGEKDREGDITITVEPAKFQIMESCGGIFPDNYISIKIAGEYIRTLEHVPYTGIGINWQCISQHSEPEKWINERFIKEGKWQSLNNKIRVSSIKLAFDIMDATCFLSLAEITFRDKPGVGIDVNFHNSPKESGRFKINELQDILSRWISFQDALIKALKKIFYEE